MNRRSFLLTAGTLALSQWLLGCRQSSRSLLQVRLLEGSIPIQLLKEFQRQVQTTALDFVPDPQLADLYERLQTWHDAASESLPPTPADLLTLGDYWLEAAIQQELIQPLPPDTNLNWQTLANADRWQALVRRDRQGQLSDTGEIWAVPYRWGTQMIAYQVERFEAEGWTRPSDWSDLWRPEFQRQISLLDSPRSVIGLTLKKLGQSVNSENLEAVPDLLDELTDLQQQVKFYSSEAYLQPLILGDTAVAVGWSTEILPLVQRDRRIAAVVPQSGTILTADLWTRPARATNLAENTDRRQLFQQWLEFCWEETIAAQISLLSDAASPRFFGVDAAQLPNSLQDKELLIPKAEILQNSEFLLPLPPAAIDQYRQLWVKVRQTAT